MTDDDPNSVFGANITVDDDNNDSSSSNQKYSTQSREQRTFQSEQDFEQQKANWTPKVDTKDELLNAISKLYPPKNKFDVITLKSACELLYFQGDYAGALDVGEKVLKAVQAGSGMQISAVERVEVETLVDKCKKRLSTSSTSPS